jgi:hypothetical protein
MSGPLVDDDGQTMIGSLFLVEAPARDEVESFHHADPFLAAGIWEQVTITGSAPPGLNPNKFESRKALEAAEAFARAGRCPRGLCQDINRSTSVRRDNDARWARLLPRAQPNRRPVGLALWSSSGLHLQCRQRPCWMKARRQRPLQ